MSTDPAVDALAPSPRARWAAVASLVGATLFWAGNYVVGASAVETIDPLSLVLLRWTLALVPLLLIAQVVERPRWGEVLSAWPWLVALAALGLVAYNLLLYTALEHIGAFEAALVNAFNPALITLSAAAFLRQRLTVARIGGILVALAGVLIVLSGGELRTLLHTGFGEGQLLMLGAILAWTGYTITGRLAPPLPPIAATTAQVAVTVLVLTPLTLATGGVDLPATPQAATSLGLIALFPSVLAYLLWNRALSVLPAGSAGVFLNLITVFTAMFTILAGQPYTAAQLIGGAIVIVGVLVTSSSGRSHRRVGLRPSRMES